MKPVAAVPAGGAASGPSELISSMWDDTAPPVPAATPEGQVALEIPEDTSPAGVGEGDTGDTAPTGEKSSIPSGLIPEAAPSAATPDTVDEPVPEGVARDGAKGMNAYQKIKLEKKEALKKASELEKKIQELEARVNNGQKPPEMQQLVDMQKQIKEYEDRIGQLDITQSKAFKTRFDLPISQTVKQGEALLARSGMSPEQAQTLVQQLIKAPDAHTASELIADQPVPVQGALYTIATNVSRMIGEREDAIANWRETQAAQSETDVRDQEISLAQNIEQDTSEAVQQALEEGNFMYTKNGTMPKEWNEAVDQRITAVKGILRNSKPAELVKWVVEGLTARDLRAMLSKEHLRANKLEQELQSRHSLRPRLGGSDHSAAPRAAGGGSTNPVDLADRLFA